MTEEVKKTATIAPESNSEVESLKKELENANTKIGKQGGEIEDYIEFGKKANILASVIRADDNIRESVEKKFNQMYGGEAVVEPKKESGEQQKEETKEEAARGLESKKLESLAGEIDTIKGNNRDQILKDFEDTVGISNMDSAEEKKKIRGKLADVFAKFGREFKDIPTHLLEDSLKSAYKAVDLDRAISEGKLEAVAEVYRNSAGALPNMGSRDIDATPTDTLTPAQKEWAGKLDVDVGEAEKTYKDRDNEQTRVPEKKQE